MDRLIVASFLLSCAIPIIVLLLRNKVKSRWGKGNALNIPPGTTGFPFIGETIQFAKSHRSTTVGKFIQERVKRYGKIFRTQLSGKPTIISVDWEFNAFILANEGKLFEHSLPSSFVRILGNQVVELQMTNRILRNTSHRFLSLNHVRSRFMVGFERLLIDVLQSWRKDIVFPALQELAKVPFFLMMDNILSLNSNEEITNNLFGLFSLLLKGFISIPLNVPGTSFREALKVREAIVGILKQLIEKRSTSGLHEYSDYLSILLESPNVNKEQMVWHIYGIILAANETTTLTMCLAMYFLGTCPKAVKQLQEEHNDIIQKKKLKGEHELTWKDFKEMKFTQHVFDETLRLGNVILCLPKKAKVDVEFKGYEIPKGWDVFLFFPGMHLDPQSYNEPGLFNPWRWEEEEKRHGLMESFMPFSRGMYMCAGKELARMEISVFLHHLVTLYEWELQDNDHPEYKFGLCTFPKGLPIKITPRVEK